MGRLSLMSSPSIEECQISSGSPRTLTITTLGVAPSATEVILHIEHPVFTVTAVAKKVHIEQLPAEVQSRSRPMTAGSSLNLPQKLLSEAAQHERDRELLPRDLKFRPQLETHRWQLELPSEREFMEKVGFCEGVLVCEMAACRDIDQKTIFTSDAHEFVHRAPDGMWRGLYIEQGGANSRNVVRTS